MHAPVIGAASAEARNATSAATSSGRMNRARVPCGIFARSVREVAGLVAAAEVARLAGQHRRVDVPGADRVHANAVRRQLQREDFVIPFTPNFDAL